MNSKMKIISVNSENISEYQPVCFRKQGDGSLFDNPRLPLAKQTFIGMMIMPGKQ